MSEVKQPYAFSFLGNWLCLDFINTLDDRTLARPEEHLNSYGDLVAWSEQAGILTGEEAQRLLAIAAERPIDAAAVLQKAVALREMLFRIFSQIAQNNSPAETDMKALNTVLAETMVNVRIRLHEQGFTWDWAGRDTALECMLWDITRSAANLLASEELRAVRICAADDCNWLFLDTSKNRSRRWCDMQACGNRSKVNRHYERRKQKNSGNLAYGG